MGNLFGTMDSSFSKWVLLIAKISVTSEVIYEKLQRNYGCSRRLTTQRISSFIGEYLSLPEPFRSHDLLGTARSHMENNIKEIVVMSFDHNFS